MSRLSPSSDDVRFAEEQLRRIALAVGDCIGCNMSLRCHSFISASSGLECWRAFISDTDEFVSVKQFSWIPSASSREAAILRLLNRCLDFFGVRSTEECELKLAVLGRHAVENMLGVKGRP